MKRIRPRRNRRRPRLQALEDRRLLVAAIDLASIGGLVFDDLTGNGFQAGEEVANASLDLYRDDGDGVFEPGAGDNVVSMAMTGGDGRYAFDRLTAGSYFVLQPVQNASGTMLQRSVSPLITINATDVTGQITQLVDSFDTTEQIATDAIGDGTPITDSVAASEAIGNQRDLFVNKTSADGSVQISVNSPTLRNRVSIRLDDTASGERRIIWDGSGDDPSTVSDTGLGGINLSNDAEGIQFQVRADLAGGNALVRIYSNDGAAGTASRFSTATLPIPVTQGSFLSPEFIPFNDFVASAGGGADFTDVGAIELEITSTPDTDVTGDLLGAVGTTPFAADFDNFETADLSLTKSVDDTTPTVGQQVNFTVTVNNAGPDSATGVIVTDALPTGITFVNSNTATGTYNSGNGQWTVGQIASGGNAALTITGTVNAPDLITNTAQVTAADQIDSDSMVNNNVESEDDQASVTLTPETIDLSLTKTIDNAMPNVGENVVFTVTVRNDGPSVATGVSVQDALPTGVTLVSNIPSTGNFNTTSGVWTIPTIGVGQTASLALTTAINTTGGVTNTAQVIAADQSDTDSEPNNNVATEDDQASVSLTTPVADLSLTKTVDNAAPNVGDQVNFTVTLNNAGPDAATSVSVSDVLPPGLTLISSNTSAGTYVGTTGQWTVGNVVVGATPTLNVRARVDSAGATTNTAQVSASDQFDPDSNPGNNVLTEDDQASAVVDPPSIDLSLTKTIDTPRPNVGDTVTYTVSLSNAGPNTATGIIVSDSVPTGLTYLTDTPQTGTYNSGNGQWTVPTLASGQTTTLMLRARVDSPTAATNTAAVIAANEFDTDSMPANNVEAEDDQASIAFTLASADLSVTKTVSNESPNIGDNVTFTVTVNNAGPDAATNVSLRDQLPPETTFVSASPSTGMYDVGTGVWTIGSLGANGSATLSIVATANASTLATNTAEITAADQADPDSNPGNGVAGEDDLATAQIQGQQIDLSLTKAISDSAPNVGDDVTFTVIVRNDGVSMATGVVVTDTLPPGVTLTGNTPSQGSFNTTTRAWTVGTLNVGGSASIDLVTRIDQVIASATNVAQVTAANQPDIDSAPGNNLEAEDDQASVTFSTPVADLSLTKTVSNPTPNIGDLVTYDIMLRNDGPDTATGVTVTDLLPSGMNFESNSLSEGIYNSATGLWDIGSLTNGATATLSINATVQNQGVKSNTARVTASDQFDPDSTAGNNVEAEDDQASVDLTPPVIDLSLTKTATPMRPAVGETVTFTLTAANAGPSDATGVVVTDTLPTGVTFVSADTPVGNFNPISGQWTIGSLAAGTNAVLQLTTTLTGTEVQTNTAEVTAASEFDSDSIPGNTVAGEDDLATVSVTPASADLSLTKTIDDATPNVGESVNFTLTVNNAGPDPSGQVTVRDQLPAGMTFVSASPMAAFDPISGIWTIDNVPSGSSAMLRILASVDSVGDKINGAEIITSGQFDPDSTPGNNDPAEDDQADVGLSPQLVDLALTKMIDDANPNVGDTILYSLELTNGGPTDATGVAVTDQLPAGVIFESATASQGSYSASNGVWTLGNVAVGVTPTLQISATVADTRGETNTAEITAVDQPDIDSTPANNMVGEDDQASVDFITQVADLSLTKTVDNSTPNRGERVNFLLTLANTGPDNASNVSVRDVLPQGLKFVSANPSTGNYDPVQGIWTLTNVPNGTSVTLGIEAEVVSTIGTDNTAEVIAVRQFDPDSAPGNAVPGEDDIATAIVTPPVADVSVSAAVDNPAPLVGDVVTLTFTARNDGPAGATGVVVSAPIPTDGLTILSVQPQRGTYDLATGTWTIGALADGAETSLIVRAMIDERGLKQITVEVIATDQFDIDSIPDNGVDSEDDQTDLIIRAPRLLTKRLFLSR